MKYEIYFNPETRHLSDNYLKRVTAGDVNATSLDFIIPLRWITVREWAEENGFTAYCVFDREHIIPLPDAESTESTVQIIHLFGWEDQYYMIPYRDGSGYWIYDRNVNECIIAWAENIEDARVGLTELKGETEDRGYTSEIVEYPDISNNPDNYPEEYSGSVAVPQDILNRPYFQIQLKFQREDKTFYSLNIIEIKVNKAIR